MKRIMFVFGVIMVAFVLCSCKPSTSKHVINTGKKFLDDHPKTKKAIGLGGTLVKHSYHKCDYCDDGNVYVQDYWGNYGIVPCQNCGGKGFYISITEE